MNRKICLFIAALFLALTVSSFAYFDPTTTSFLSRDPIREDGGVNLYAYCNDDPVGNFDAIGLDPEPVGAFIDANGNPQVLYQDWSGTGLVKFWNSTAGGNTTTWTQAPNADELARLFRLTGGGQGWRVATYDERMDAFQQQFAASFPIAMQNAGGTVDAVMKIDGGAFAAATGAGLLLEGPLTLGTGVAVGHEFWFTGSSWGSAVTGNNVPLSPEGLAVQGLGGSPDAVAATDTLAGFGAPMLAGRGPVLEMPEFGPKYNLLNYRFATDAVYTGIPLRFKYVGPPETAIQSNQFLEGLTPLPGTRGTGVSRASALEVELVQKTGLGTLDWTPEEIEYIQQTGQLPKGIVGHHINSVVEYPDWAGDPRNIRFTRGQSGNLLLHEGNFQNPTVGPLIDRAMMIELAP